MIKHIITTTCSRSCHYCITKNLPAIEALLDEAYAAQGETSLMLTGGEPTTEPDLLFAAFNAGRRYFEDVHLTTANGRFLHHWTAKFFDSIVYSHHDRPAAELPFVGPSVRSYLAILADQFSQDLVGRAHDQRRAARRRALRGRGPGSVRGLHDQDKPARPLPGPENSAPRPDPGGGLS